MMPFSVAVKPGCRGDPRMNRAVAAKLARPSLSLFESLRIGGFNYPENVDAATMDNDMVTLGQRKNQLNRRLRTARKRCKGQYMIDDEADSFKAASALCGRPSAAEPESHGSSMMGGTKRSLPQVLEDTSPNKVLRLSQASIAAYNHQDLGGCGSGQAVAASRISGPDASSTESDAQLQRPAEEFALSASSVMVNPSSVMAHSLNQQHSQMLSQSFAAGTIAEQGQVRPMGKISNATTGSNNILSAFLWQQQAAATQQWNNDEIYGRQANLNEAIAARQDGRYESAMRFFSNELLGLYHRCMMRAGYTVEESCPSSLEYRKFAFDAWKAECERLQTLLATDSSNPVVQQPEACLPPLPSACDISVDLLRLFQNDVSGAGNRL